MSAGHDTPGMDTENARQEIEQMMASKRAGPLGRVVRKQFWFWTTLPDLDLHGGDTYRVVAAAKRVVETTLPAEALAGLGTIQARRGMVRTGSKIVFGKPVGVFEINLSGKDMADIGAHVVNLAAAGLHVMQPEDDFDEATCSHILVPKLSCVMPLYKKLVDPGMVTKMCYALGGGAQGQGNDKARLIVDISAADLAQKLPELVTLEQGSFVVACELGPDGTGQIDRWPLMSGTGKVPGLGRLRFALLSPGLSRQSSSTTAATACLNSWPHHRHRPRRGMTRIVAGSSTF